TRALSTVINASNVRKRSDLALLGIEQNYTRESVRLLSETHVIPPKQEKLFVDCNPPLLVCSALDESPESLPGDGDHQVQFLGVTRGDRHVLGPVPLQRPHPHALLVAEKPGFGIPTDTFHRCQLRQPLQRKANSASHRFLSAAFNSPQLAETALVHQNVPDRVLSRCCLPEQLRKTRNTGAQRSETAAVPFSTHKPGDRSPGLRKAPARHCRRKPEAATACPFGNSEKAIDVDRARRRVSRSLSRSAQGVRAGVREAPQSPEKAPKTIT
ncbi:MAG: hypothetical protein BJ554DRAFT_5175, partial [Olpidium bornovanus]